MLSKFKANSWERWAWQHDGESYHFCLSVAARRPQAFVTVAGNHIIVVLQFEGPPAKCAPKLCPPGLQTFPPVLVGLHSTLISTLKVQTAEICHSPTLRSPTTAPPRQALPPAHKAPLHGPQRAWKNLSWHSEATANCLKWVYKKKFFSSTLPLKAHSRLSHTRF